MSPLSATDNKEPVAAEQTAKPLPQKASLLFTGDLMVHKPQITKAKRANGYDFHSSFEFVTPVISSADLAVGNLETTLSGEKQGYSGYPCFNAPDEFADALKDAGFDVLTTTNNHCMDRNFYGLCRTVAQLDAKGISHFGTYAKREDREKVLVKEVNGIKVAFIGWTYGTNGIRIDSNKKWSVALTGLNEVKKDVERAKALKSDLIVAMPHIGTEYLLTPPSQVQSFVGRLLEFGVNIVIASHPHVVQPFEFRNGNFIAWSMGNFISNQRPKPRDMGVMVKLSIEKSGGKTLINSAEIIPTWVQVNKNDGSKTSRVLIISDALSKKQDYQLKAMDILRLEEADRDFSKRIMKMTKKADVPGYIINNK